MERETLAAKYFRWSITAFLIYLALLGLGFFGQWFRNL